MGTDSDTSCGARSCPGARLRSLFARPGPVRIVGAHNPLCARLAERAGFDGVWSGGLEISASQGVPDADILDMSELLGVARSMAASVDIPVVADCDAGYGNASNVMHMVRRYEAAGVAAVTIEDKRFPKMNSFIPDRQDLAPVGEFAGKIAAAKSAQRDPHLMVVARVEALVAGWGLDEALRRGEHYAAAGADAILIHSKDPSPARVLAFLRQWRLPQPLVVVPTTYHTATADELAEAGAKLVVYANHGLRSAVSAMEETFAAILRDGRTTALEERIAPLSTVFDLQGMAGFRAAEQRYVLTEGRRVRALVLPAPDRQAGEAALRGEPVASLRTAALRRAGIDHHLPGTATGDGDPVLDAPADFDGTTVVVAPDVLFDHEPVVRLIAADWDVAVLVNPSPDRGDDVPGCRVDLSVPTVGGRRLLGARSSTVTAVQVSGGDADLVGVAAFSRAGFAALQDAVEKRRDGATGDGSLAGLLADLIREGWAVRAVEVASGWTEVRTGDDLRRADTLLFGSTP